MQSFIIGLAPGVAYACLAETALLAMEGRFEDFTLGRQITMERVKEIYCLFKKHQFQIASLRSFDRVVTDEMVGEKRALAEKLRRDPILLAQTRRQASEKIATMPIAAKGVSAGQERHWFRPATVFAGLSVTAAFLFARRK